MKIAAQSLDLNALAFDLGFAPQNIFYLVKLRDSLYVRAELPKRSPGGGVRIIHIPKPELKGVQRAILKKYLERVPTSPYAYAYVKDRSVVSAAAKLAGHKAVLRVDLKDFFPSITQARVLGLFKSLGFGAKAAWILSNLTTREGFLAQGAPTSPAISNLIARSLDNELAKLAASWDLNYIRYSDDLFFHGPTNFGFKSMLPYISEVCRDNSFRINEGKTRYFPKGMPRCTLGLMTHSSRPKIPREARHRMRAAFFKASHDLRWGEKSLSRLSGLLEWYKSVYGQDETYKEYKKIIANITGIKLHDAYAV